MPSGPHVAIAGGGLAGLAAAIPLAEHGMRVTLVERQPRLGGRATSYTLPSGETIDNCQHVTLRCCTNLDDFYRRLGVSHHITFYNRLVFGDSKGRRSEIRSRSLPAPLNLAPSFAAFRLLSWRDKYAIVRALLRIIRAGGRPAVALDASMLDWLQKNGQTQNAIDRFWRVVLVSALNEQLDRTSAAYGIDVFWKAFLSNREGFGIGVPNVPLEALYASATPHIQRSNGLVRTRCGAAELCVSGADIGGLRLDDGSVLTADYYVAAVPFERLLKILPPGLSDLDVFANVRKLHVSPITSVHLWLDRVVTTEPFVTSVDQTIQWVFNKTPMGRCLQVVISASHDLAEMSQQEIIDLCWKELAALLPGVREAKLQRAIVIRENAATFSPEPGCDRWRPSSTTPLRNFFLAGDWTNTGWPATMEGAVRSGYRAAEEILASQGKRVQLVQPDLPIAGIVRWLSAR